MSDLKTLFLSELRQMFDCEHLLVQGLSQLEFCAHSRKLKLAVHLHLSQTRKHVERLELVFREIAESPDRKPCEAIEGILDEAQLLVQEFGDNSALDAALIGAAQKAEHYEIGAYTNLVRWARQLGYESAALLLEENLSDERQTDTVLTALAEWFLNVRAKRHDTQKEPEPEAALGKAMAFGH